MRNADWLAYARNPKNHVNAAFEEIRTKEQNVAPYFAYPRNKTIMAQCAACHQEVNTRASRVVKLNAVITKICQGCHKLGPTQVAAMIAARKAP